MISSRLSLGAGPTNLFPARHCLNSDPCFDDGQNLPIVQRRNGKRPKSRWELRGQGCARIVFRTMTSHFDVAIVGLGAMGSAAALHLARRGARVLGIDRFAPPHRLGSSHGYVRLIREAYYEDPLYVPLVRRSFELWRELERTSGGHLVTPSGVLLIGRPESDIVRGASRSAAEHGILHELLTAREAMERFPSFVIDEGLMVLHEPGAALLHPERCVATHLELASRHGAVLQYQERVHGVETTAEGVRLQTAHGTYLARQVVITAGAWMPELVPDLALPLTIEREVQHWFEPVESPEQFRAGQMPVAMCELPDGRLIYTMPDIGHGLKIGWHHSGCLTTTEQVDRVVSPEESAEMHGILQRFIPQAAGKALGAEVCFYTNTPDHHFLISRHPRERGILLVSACSGHGFKFAAVIGEIVADLVTSGSCAFDLRPFDPGRFQGVTRAAAPPGA